MTNAKVSFLKFKSIYSLIIHVCFYFDRKIENIQAFVTQYLNDKDMSNKRGAIKVYSFFKFSSINLKEAFVGVVNICEGYFMLWREICR